MGSATNAALNDYLDRFPNGRHRSEAQENLTWSKAEANNTVQALHDYQQSLNTDLALGAKYSHFGNGLVTGNVQIKLDDGGLRAKVVSLIGASNTF